MSWPLNPRPKPVSTGPPWPGY